MVLVLRSAGKVRVGPSQPCDGRTVTSLMCGGTLVGLLMQAADGVKEASGCELYIINNSPALMAGPPERIKVLPVGGKGLAKAA